MSGDLVLPEGFGRAAEKLADTVRHVVDVVIGPDRVRAQAQAQADAALIAARGRVEIADIETRAVERLRKREARRQQNIESITEQAVKVLPPPSEISETPVNADWTSRFFEECQDIGDEQMQQIWAKILAGEVARPGSFAPKTLSVVRDLTKIDAELFATVCRSVWFVPGAGYLPIIPTPKPSNKDDPLRFGQLMHLASIGLIEFNSVTEFAVSDLSKEQEVRYCDEAVKLKSEPERQFPIGNVVFTAVGRELLKMVQAEGNKDFKKVALDYWNERGWREEVQATSSQDPVASA